MPSVPSAITWQELAAHNNDRDAWLAVRGKVYNVTSWISKHPGGEDMIVLNAGRDATQLFEAYHPIKTHQLLHKYYVGELVRSELPSFPPVSDFYVALKNRVEDYFTSNDIDPREWKWMLLRSVLLVMSALWLHFASVSLVNLGWEAAGLLTAVLMGIVCALICFMPVHEASHGSTGHSSWGWRLLGSVHDYLNGASYYVWLHQHFLGHHPFTSIDFVDPDIHTNDPDVRRIKPYQPWYSMYRYQQFYVPVLYGVLGIKFRINDVIIMFSSKANGAVRLNPPDTWHLVMFVAGKICFFIYRIVVPAFYIGFIQSLLLFLVSDVATSYVLAFIFQVNHVVSGMKWPKADQNGFVNVDWAKMQTETTMDYGHDSWFTTFFTGALNYQVVHHLFPGVSQMHYPALAPIIKKTCEEYGVKYNYVPTFWDALQCHLTHLKVMGHGKADS